MSAESLATEPVVFPLRTGRGKIALHGGGFRHPGSFGRERFTAYADLTHLVTGARSIRIGTLRGVTAIPRSFFREPADADRLVRALLERVAQEPGGSMQLARMAEIEETLRDPFTPWATRILVLACLAVFGLEMWIGPIIHHAGFFSAALVGSGEPWRLVTANLLHADAVHLGLNVLGLAALGGLVERALGTARTSFVMGVSALGAMCGGWIARYELMVGASGIVAGLLGALVWLELRFPERLPATWRIPRRLLWVVLVLQALLDISLPFIAAAAHLGGFIAGMLGAALCAGPGLRREPVAAPLRLATALLVVVALTSIALATRIVSGGAAIERHAERLLRIEGLPAQLLNDAAWMIATGRKPSDTALAHADALAERAVEATERLDPNMLDTLAEVEFQMGHDDAALDTIDEAIALAPGVAYFHEQRRRFSGERAADDRPAPPDDSIRVAPPGAPEDEPYSPSIDDEENPGIAI